MASELEEKAGTKKDKRLRGAREINMLSGPIGKEILLFFAPIFIGSLFQQLYNMVDTIVVGQYVGTNALAAVGATGSVINLLVGFFVGIASGATVIISQYFGAGDGERVSKAVHTGIAFSIVSGLVIMVIGVLTARWTMVVTSVPASILDDAVTYMKVYYYGVVAMMIYNIGTGILRAIGDSRRPLYILIVCCLVNIVLDLVFVLVCHWAVFGVALATVIAQVVSAVCVVVLLMRTHECYRLMLRRIRFHGEEFQGIIRIGIPAGLESVIYSFTNIILQAKINEFDTAAIAAWSTASRMDAIMWMVMQSFSVSISTFVGQNFGARQYDRTKQGINTGLKINMVAIVIISALLMIFCPYLYRIFTKDAQVIEIATKFTRIFAPSYPMFVFINVYSASIRGCGESLQPMLIAMFGICGIRLLWIYLVVLHYHTMWMVAASYDVSWTISAIVYLIYYRRGHWLTRCKARQVGKNIHEARAAETSS